MSIPSICPTLYMVKKRRSWILREAIADLHRGARVGILQNFWNGSVKLRTGEVAPEYFLDEELQIIPGVL